MYNTRRSNYLNSTTDDLPEEHTTSWNHNVPVSRYSIGATKGRSSSPVGESPPAAQSNNDALTDNNIEMLKKTTRKRANTTSTSGEAKRTANKICRVCGDKAFSYNFNVITCESCKAFFRRNANKEKEIRCPFNEQCEINVVSRRFCQRCRLAKCFQVGMKKEWIMSDEARLVKKQRVEENRERRLQDAMNRYIDDDPNENEQSLDEQPSQSNNECSAAPTTAASANDEPKQCELRPIIPTTTAAGADALKTDELPPSVTFQSTSFGNRDYDFVALAPQPSAPPSTAFNPHQVVDPIPTTGATSTANVSATTSAVSTMDIDPTTTMTSNGFIPPPVPTIADNSAGALMSSVKQDFDNQLMSAHAHAQLAAQVQHVQAAINHQQQQLAAAVVAQQVVAQMTAPPVQPPPLQPVQTIAAPLAPLQPQLPPLPAPVPTLTNNVQLPTMNPAPTLPTLSLPKVESPNMVLMNQLGHASSTDMVTIPKEMLLKLIQNSAHRSVSCSCTCVCGRYPPGSNIVEEVTKDLINGGSSNSSSAEPQKEETKLDTAEDMQRNGLLPSDDSSVQWLNTAAPTVDPSNFADESSNPRRESLYNTLLNDNASGIIDNEPREFTSHEADKLEEVNQVANRWISDGLDTLSLVDLITGKGVPLVISGLKLLSSFRALKRDAQVMMISGGLHAYCIVKWIQHHDSISLDGIDPSLCEELKSLFKEGVESYRVQPGTFNTLAALILFDTDDQLASIAHCERDEFCKLLQKVICNNTQSNLIDRAQLTDIIPKVHHLAGVMRSVVGSISANYIDTLL